MSEAERQKSAMQAQREPRRRRGFLPIILAVLFFVFILGKLIPNGENDRPRVNPNDLRQARELISGLPSACKKSRVSSLLDGTVSINISCEGNDLSMEGVVEIKDGIVKAIR